MLYKIMDDSIFWKKYFEVYDNLNTLKPYRELLSAIVKELEITQGNIILDAGSCTGNLSIELVKQGAHVTAIDFSKEGIRRHKSKQPEVNIIYTDLTDPLPFKNSSFDKVVSNNTIYTISPNRRAEIFN